MPWSRGDRFVLLQSHTTAWGQRYGAGQRGQVVHVFGSTVAVEFDGHEAERAEDRRRIELRGEGLNIVAWACELELALIGPEAAG